VTFPPSLSPRRVLAVALALIIVSATSAVALSVAGDDDSARSTTSTAIAAATTSTGRTDDDSVDEPTDPPEAEQADPAGSGTEHDAADDPAPATPSTQPSVRRTRRASVTSTTVDWADRGVPDPWRDELRREIDAWIAADPTALRISAAVVAPGRDIVWSDVSSKPNVAPFGIDDRYPIMSITKSMTAALVLREAAAGHLDLDAPVPAIPGVEVAEPARSITPRMLLQHTSGLVNYTETRGYDPNAAITPNDIVRLATRTPLWTRPGGGVRYANTNYHWLGLLLEHLTGRTYADLVADLGREAGLPTLAIDAPPRPGWVGYASGGAQANVRDVARWGDALFTPGRVLAPDWLTQLSTTSPLGTGLGVWPLCPCPAAPDGTTPPTALGQVVSTGTLVHSTTTGLTIAVRIEPAPRNDAQLTDLAARIQQAVVRGLERERTPGA